MTHDNDKALTVDDLHAVHPGAPGPGDAGALLAALDEGWPAEHILMHAERLDGLIKRQGTEPPSVERWLVALGAPPRPERGR
jgi:hypothetical protein